MSSTPNYVYWLEGPGGRVPIGSGGVLVGRSAGCDIVVPNPQVSRQHALFRPAEQGAKVLLLGRIPLEVNGEPGGAVTTLADGDRIALCGHEFRIVQCTAPAPPEADILWAIERGQGALYRISHAPFLVGGGPQDHLFVEPWPPATLVLTPVQRSLTLEARKDGVLCRGVAGDTRLEAGELVSVESGAVIDFAGQHLRLLALPRGPLQVTQPSVEPEHPTAVRLQFLPRGGRLFLTFARHEAALYLADRRCDLVATLLKPPPPFHAGELIPDELLCEHIWPNKPSGRVELNTLVFRLRRDLVKAGVDGTVLVERLAGGVRLCLAASATVTVE